MGDPLDPVTSVGPVVTEAAMERILGVIDRATADGATLLAGGGRMGGDLAEGWFVAPTVFGDVDHDSDLARNEVFGPVQAILRFSTDDEVLDKANDSPYGLAAYVHTTDPGRLARFVDGLKSGVIMANGLGDLSPATPFGGFGQSGFGPRGRLGRVRGDGAADRRAGGPTAEGDPWRRTMTTAGERPVAFVTGASRGIGKAIARHLSRAGYDVAIAARTRHEGEEREHSSTVAASNTRPLPGSLDATASVVEAEGRPGPACLSTTCSTAPRSARRWLRCSSGGDASTSWSTTAVMSGPATWTCSSTRRWSCWTGTSRPT